MDLRTGQSQSFESHAQGGIRHAGRSRRSSGHHGVGVLFESCLADHLAFVERTKRLIRHVIAAKLAARATS